MEGSAGTPAARGARTATQWSAVIAALVAGITVGAAVGKIGPAIPMLAEEFGLSLIATGWLVSMFNTIAVLVAIFFGILTDRAGSLRACLFGLACVAVGGVVAIAATGTAVLVASRVIEGLGALAVMVSAPALISAATRPRERGLALGFWSSYLPFGSGMAILVAPMLLLGPLGWRGLWGLNVAAAAVSFVLLAAQSRHFATATGGARSLASVRASLGQPVPWLLGGAFAMYALQWMGIMVWLPTYLKETQGAGATASSLLTLAFVLINIVGNQLGGYLVHQHIPRGRIITTAFIGNAFLFVVIFLDGLPGLARYLLVLLYSASTGVIASAALSGSAKYARSMAEVGSVQGLIVQLSQCGVFLSPLAIAFAVTWGGGWGATLWVFLGAGVLGIAFGLAILAFERGETRRAATPS